MEIRKRNGKSVPFQQEKIFNAMKKAFDGQGREIGGGELEEILATVLDNLFVTVPLTVERVQDEVGVRKLLFFKYRFMDCFPFYNLNK